MNIASMQCLEIAWIIGFKYEILVELERLPSLWKINLVCLVLFFSRFRQS